MSIEHSHTRGSSMIKLTAFMAVILLLGALLYSINTYYNGDGTLSIALPQNASSATPVDPLVAKTATNTLPKLDKTALAMIFANYGILKKQGGFSSSTADALGVQVAEAIKPNIYFEPLTARSLNIVQDTSYNRMIAYRTDLQTAFKPLLENKESEISIIGSYEQSKSASDLDKLRDVAANYDAAASAAAKVAVPSDAVTYHLAVINSLREFSATLNAFSDYATNSITSAAVLMSYNQAEQNVTSSFSALAKYFTTKQP